MASEQKPTERTRLSLKTVTIVLTEAGYRCAVPTCRGILALDLHHIWQVAAGGPDEPENLIALCPTCHALYHRGTIKPDSIYAYKAMLLALSHVFDVGAGHRTRPPATCVPRHVTPSRQHRSFRSIPPPSFQ